MILALEHVVTLGDAMAVLALLLVMGLLFLVFAFYLIQLSSIALDRILAKAKRPSHKKEADNDAR